MKSENYPSHLVQEMLAEARKVIEAYEEVMMEQVKTIERLEWENAALWEALTPRGKENFN